MSILVIGKTGQLAWSLQRTLPNAIFLGREVIDLSDLPNIAKVINEYQPEIIINAAAYTAVDQAETETTLAYRINAEAVAGLARAASAAGALLIHFSTDYVFNGMATRPYRETDAVSPINIYGTSKLAGELAVVCICQRYWIFRTSWVFCEHGHNFPKTMLRLAKSKDTLAVVNDQVGRPTYAGDIATIVTEAVERYCNNDYLPWGIYHLASTGETNWYAFATYIISTAMEKGILSRIPEILPISTQDYKTPARRASYSVLDTTNLAQFLRQPIPHWQTGVNRLLNALI